MLEATLSRFEIKVVKEESKQCALRIQFRFLARLNSRSWSLRLIVIENEFEREQSDLKCRLGGMHGVIN